MSGVALIGSAGFCIGSNLMRTSFRCRGSLLSQLSSLGYISDNDCDRLHELCKQRNAAVDFTSAEPPDSADIEYALDIISRMLDGQYASDT